MSGTLNTQDVLLSLGGFGLSLVVAWSLKLFLNVLLFKKKKQSLHYLEIFLWPVLDL